MKRISYDGYFDIRNISEDTYELLSDGVFHIPGYGEVTVKKGFRFDGASVPKIFWSLIGSPFTGKYILAALLHDALYASEHLSRWRADWIFLCYLKQLGVGWFKRNVMWGAVRGGGGSLWPQKKEDIEDARKLVIYNKT
jgi:hypothetical protein